ncbi:MAG: NADH-quinone oxidoreductase subunit NuoE [Nitrospirota bacterium]|jgi:NADH:ubiquinone oxidoreductase subunit E
MKVEKLQVDKAVGEVGKVLTEEQRARALLIHALQEIQKAHNYLPEDELKKLSRKLGIPLSEIYSTATFYKQFYFAPRGRNVACVCTGTACHVRGAGDILEAFEQEFGISEGETTEDKSLTLETVGCVGCCGLAPVVTVNEEVVGEVTRERFSEIVRDVRRRK